MKGDFSRRIFDKRKHYTGVLMQQGRVQVDADWNMQQAIQQYRIQTKSRDLIGLNGAPEAEAGFEIRVSPDGNDLAISPGRIYVNGILCELECLTPVDVLEVLEVQVRVSRWIVDDESFEEGQWIEIYAEGIAPRLLRIVGVDSINRLLTFDENVFDFQDAANVKVHRITLFTRQLDYPEPLKYVKISGPHNLPELNLDDGIYLVYLDVWSRHITALEDPLILETALNGPDTTTRIKTVWQVKLLSLAPEGENGAPSLTHFSAEFPDWVQHEAGTTGTLNARTVHKLAPENPYLIPPKVGYKGLENHLYRIEIHQGGQAEEATFKWSRDNGIVVTGIEKISGKEVTVNDLGQDEALGFAVDQWVEIIDDKLELHGMPGELKQIESVDPERRIITLKSDHPKPLAPNEDGVNHRYHPKLRRWDCRGELSVLDASTQWIELENGIEVQFSKGGYKAGDYWLIPARSATREIEWPPYKIPNAEPLPQPPLGINHHFCQLALLEVRYSEIQVIEDCREIFSSGTDGIRVRKVLATDYLEQDVPLCDGMLVPSNILAKGLQLWLNRKIDSSSISPTACIVTIDLPYSHGNLTIGHQPLTLGAELKMGASNELNWLPSQNSKQFLQNELLKIMAESELIKSWIVSDPPKSTQSEWRYGEGNSVVQTSEDAGVEVETPDHYGLGGTICISKERCDAGVRNIELVVTIPGASTSWKEKDVGMVFNWEDDQNYWGLICKYYISEYYSTDRGSGRGPGVFVEVTTEIVKVKRGSRYVVSSHKLERKKIAEAWRQIPSGEARFSIEQCRDYLTSEIQVKFGDIIWSKNYWHSDEQGLPEAILENSQVGMLTRFNGRAKFMSFVVEYEDIKRVLIPPERTDRVIGRLVVKPNFLRPVRESKGLWGQSYSEMSTPSRPLRTEFERWFWVVPPGAVYWYAQGDMGIGPDLIR